jgi:hypothetical protein
VNITSGEPKILGIVKGTNRQSNCTKRSQNIERPSRKRRAFLNIVEKALSELYNLGILEKNNGVYIVSLEIYKEYRSLFTSHEIKITIKLQLQYSTSQNSSSKQASQSASELVASRKQTKTCITRHFPNAQVSKRKTGATC